MTARGTTDDLRRIAAWGDPGEVPVPDLARAPLVEMPPRHHGNRHVLVAAALLLVMLAGVIAVLHSTPAVPAAAARGEWLPMAAGPLSPRTSPATVWTGTEMLIFGGHSASGATVDDGAAYNPRTNTWRRMAPYPFSNDRTWDPNGLAVWTGREMLVVMAGPDTSGADPDWSLVAYNPSTDRWRKLFDASFTQPIPDGAIIPTKPVPIDQPEATAWIGGSLVVVGFESRASRYEWVRIDIGGMRWSARHALPGSEDLYILAKAYASDGHRLVFTRYSFSSTVAPTYVIDPHMGTATKVAPPVVKHGSPALWTGPITVVSGRFTRVGLVGSDTPPGEEQRVTFVLDAGRARWVPAAAPPDSPADTSQYATLVGTPYGAVLLGGVDPNAIDVGGLKTHGATAVASDPTVERWSKLPKPPIDLHRVGMVAVWTGEEVIVWGGATTPSPGALPSVLLADGARWRIDH